MKWYIHSNGEQKGPYSTDELSQLISSGQANVATPIWKEGFPAWKKIGEVPELSSLLAPAAPQAEVQAERPKRSDDLSVLTVMPNIVDEPTATMATHVIKDIKKEAKIANKIEAKLGAKVEAKTEKTKSPAPMGPLIIIIACMIVIAGGVGSMFYFKPFMPKLPVITDLAPGDYERLQSAIAEAPDKQGVRVELALSTEDITHPRFYIASNLSDAEQFDITLQQVPGTAAEPMGSSIPMHLNGMIHHLAKTEKITLNPAEYVVSIAAESQPKVSLAASRFFLGGSRDAAYQASLDQARAKRQARAAAELQNINQGLAQLDAFQVLIQKMLELPRAEKVQNVRNRAKALQAEWDRAEKDLPQRSILWQPDPNGSEPDVVYPRLFHLGRECWAAQKEAYMILQKYFLAPAPELIPSINEQSDKAIGSLVALKAEIEKTHPAETP